MTELYLRPPLKAKMSNIGAIMEHIDNVEKRPLLKSPSLVYNMAALYKTHFEQNHDNI